MKKGFTILIALLTWFAVIMQYVLMIQNRTADVVETTIRFFSFFTILTNIIVAIFFTNNIYSKKLNSSKLTAVTVYITIVGLIYQVILRQTWKPEGMQFIVNELLHTLIPLLVIIFWCMYAVNRLTPYSRIGKWAIYPLVYLVYVLIRGNFAGFYPYPFIDVTNLGMEKTLVNAAMILVLFIALAAIFLFIGKRIIKR
ncbi:MAG: Pr6Pr family membrane protein [Ferruginibacter sp.]